MSNGNCPGCGEIRLAAGQGVHVHSGLSWCMPLPPGEDVMAFWKENRLDRMFSWPISAVRDAFLDGCDKEKLAVWPTERALRDWLTDPAGFNSTWVDENSFTRLLDSVRTKLKEEMDHA